MAMIKTDKARHALRNRASLSVQERQILILCDGIRSRQEIAGWLGDSALVLIDGLAAQGYLEPKAAAGVPRSAAPARATRQTPEWREAALMPIGIDLQPTRPAPLPVASPSPSPATAATKRSLAACKMYAQGILQMQRGSDAQQMLAQLNASQDEDGLVGNLMGLLQFLQQKTNASYAENVKKHMLNILPERHLGSLQAA